MKHLKRSLTPCIFLVMLVISAGIHAASVPPRLAFSDLISGPDSGLDDRKGSGVIVTVWGQHLGSTQGNSTIEYCDSEGVCRPGYIYYWKNADGRLPSGPAKLYESHRMQEIAFSIPQSARGLGKITVTVEGNTSSLPFTVRSGNIYHVKDTGSDSSGDGSFDRPWQTIAKGDSYATAGDTLYIHDVTTVNNEGQGRVVYNNRGFKANTENQFAYASYPGTRAELYGKDGVHFYLTTGIVTSKLSVFASNCADETLVGCVERGTVGISTSDWGRVIGNSITDRPGMCASGQAGAISGGVDRAEGAIIYGNYIYEYGCPNTGKLHHTTYLTIRDNKNSKKIQSWRMGWNYLKDNHAKNGLHFFDEDLSGNGRCGDLTTDMHIHDNVVVNQGGAGIHVESACGWSQDTFIYNNTLVNTGLPVDIDCKMGCGSPGSAIIIKDNGPNGLLGNVYINNNTVYNWDTKNQSSTLQSCIVLRGYGDDAKVFFNDNICYTDYDKPFSTLFSFSASVDHSDNIVGSNNIFFSHAASPKRALLPSWAKDSINKNPQLELTGSTLSINQGSPALNQSRSIYSHDIYGVMRDANSAIGSTDFYIAPNPPDAPILFQIK